MNALRVKPLGRLIEQHQLRRRQQRLREPEPLPHPVAVSAHGIMDARRESHDRHGVLDLAPRHDRGVARENFEILPAAQVIVKRRRLKDRADPRERPRTFLLDRDAVDEHLARIREHLPEHDPESRALARPIVPEQTEDLSTLHRERQVAQGRLPLEGFRQIFQFDHAGHREAESRTFPAARSAGNPFRSERNRENRHREISRSPRLATFQKLPHLPRPSRKNGGVAKW